MADAAGLYDPLWRPYRLYGVADNTEEAEKTNPIAGDIIDKVEIGLAKLKADPERYKKYNPPNGWGSYDILVKFTEKYLYMLKKFPDAIIKADR